jgi:DNA-directed RNA polymerase subunit alpha
MTSQITTIQNHLFTSTDWQWIQGGRNDDFCPSEITKAAASNQYREAYKQFCQGNYDKTLDMLAAVRKQYADVLAVAYNYMLTYLAASQPDVEQIWKKNLKGKETTAAYHYLRGMLLERDGNYMEAMACYQASFDEDFDFMPAAFRLAYLSDLRGDEEYSRQLYEDCLSSNVEYANLWINLGLLYEENGEYGKAVECYQKILDKQPCHGRALMFIKDARASMSMYVDEEKERENNKLNEVLSTPITDFELSVRSKNCLNKMKIKSLGDLIKKSEAELLSYKNFGETSLAEIKGILEKKGLKLGMGLEEKTITKKKEKKGIKVVTTVTPPNQELLDIPIGTLELSVRSRKCLNALNIKTVGELIQKRESELLLCRNFGHTSLAEIKRKLAELGVSLIEG